ncbi:hypothetical protein P7K49_012049 [Saguinus oedipus]|uniref:Uncharacterized protein n=1 Tax=Saguinus oedipus TaxID=9490 RepID=A0ABQ9VSN4_SAGOE|nr:hypothetical protein P7K49_012049 [Saguinus oedipus]
MWSSGGPTVTTATQQPPWWHREGEKLSVKWPLQASLRDPPQFPRPPGLTLNPTPPFLQHRQASMRTMTAKSPEKDTATTAREDGQDSSLSGAPSVGEQHSEGGLLQAPQPRLDLLQHGLGLSTLAPHPSVASGWPEPAILWTLDTGLASPVGHGVGRVPSSQFWGHGHPSERSGLQGTPISLPNPGHPTLLLWGWEGTWTLSDMRDHSASCWPRAGKWKPKALPAAEVRGLGCSEKVVLPVPGSRAPRATWCLQAIPLPNPPPRCSGAVSVLTTLGKPCSAAAGPQSSSSPGKTDSTARSQHPTVEPSPTSKLRHLS